MLLFTVVKFDELTGEALKSIDDIVRPLSTIQKVQQSREYVQYTLVTRDTEGLKAQARILAEKYEFDFALVRREFANQPKLLFIFDMDSTLINAEVIDQMAHAHGVGDKVKEITMRAMNGELNFDQSLSERVKMLKGLSQTQMRELDKTLPLNPGVEDFMKKVQALGHKTAIASGGFSFFANDLGKRLKMDHVFSNELEFKDEVLTGGVLGKVINAEAKAEIVETLSEKEQLTPAQVITIGDGANDIPMLSKAAIGVAYHAKEKVRKAAQFHINYGPMNTLLYYLGFQD